MNRRSFFALPFFAFLARGDAASEVWQMFAGMAESLSADNIDGFLKPIDPKMPGFEELGRYIRGIVEQAETRSIINPVSDEGDDRARTVQLQWFLQMKRRGSADSRTENREQVVTFGVARQGKRWRIISTRAAGVLQTPEFQLDENYPAFGSPTFSGSFADSGLVVEAVWVVRRRNPPTTVPIAAPMKPANCDTAGFRLTLSAVAAVMQNPMTPNPAILVILEICILSRVAARGRYHCS